jgi:hypothetical protein
MRFNSTTSEEPYQGLKFSVTAGRKVGLLSRTPRTGAAWLSSARALRCSLKWGNERNPYRVLQVSRETAPPNAYEVRVRNAVNVLDVVMLEFSNYNKRTALTVSDRTSSDFFRNDITSPTWPASQASGGEEGGDDVKSAWPFDALGDTHVTMVMTMGCQAVRRSKSHKHGPSSDCGLKLARMKPESLVIAYQPRCGEYVLESCTHRPSRQGSREEVKIHFDGFSLGSVTWAKS